MAELQSVYQQNEMTILGLYRQMENARKQVEDSERQIQNANSHQQGVQREADDGDAGGIYRPTASAVRQDRLQLELAADGRRPHR